MRQILILLLTIMVLQTVMCEQKPRSITSYKNCHQQWFNIPLNEGPQTICEGGSLITSLAMLLQSNGLPINNLPANPRWLNKYLKANSGYPTDGRAVDFQVIGKLGLQLIETVNNPQKMRKYFDDGYDVIINHNYGKNYLPLLLYELNGTEYIYYINNPQNDEKKIKESDITVAMIFKKKE